MKRVVITGLGVVSCLGNDRASVSRMLVFTICSKLPFSRRRFSRIRFRLAHEPIAMLHCADRKRP